jgi:hypothetical protein
MIGTVGESLDIDMSPRGMRRIIPVTGGTFEGSRLRGAVLPGGADCMFMRPDGVAQVDVRITLKTDDGALIYMKYGGYRHGPAEVMDMLARGEDVDPSQYYFRITPVFETGSPTYDWLNRIVAVGSGHRQKTGPVYEVYEIL